MDLNFEKEQLCSCRIVREAKAEQNVDCDMTLPDYCPDIKSILRCSVEPGISSVTVAGNRVTAQGNAVIRLVYVSTDDKMSCFEQNYPLSKFVEMNSLRADSQAVATAKTAYVNCRAVSPRRVDIHGCISVLFSVWQCEKTEYISDIIGDGVQLKLSPISVCNAVGCASKNFDMSEVVPLTDSGVKAVSVADSYAYAVLNSVKAVSNKLLVKGELMLNVTLCCEDGGVKKMEHSMPISRIIELEGVDESCICDIRSEVSPPDLHLRTDESTNTQSIDAAVCIGMFVCSYRQQKCACVEDAYLLSGELEVGKVSFNTNRFIQSVDESCLVSFTADLDGCEAQEIIDCRCDSVTCISTSGAQGAELSGAVTVSIIYRDKEGKIASLQRQGDYHFTKPCDGAENKVFCDADVCAVASSAVGKGSQVSVKVQLNVRGSIFESVPVTVVNDVKQLEHENKVQSASITVYFSESGEKLWDIAKKYNTSEDAIRRRNSIKGDVIEKETMLIIPRI